MRRGGRSGAGGGQEPVTASSRPRRGIRQPRRTAPDPGLPSYPCLGDPQHATSPPTASTITTYHSSLQPSLTQSRVKRGTRWTTTKPPPGCKRLRAALEATGVPAETSRQRKPFPSQTRTRTPEHGSAHEAMSKPRKITHTA